MICWNREQQRLRAGWRIVLQIVLAVVLSALTAPLVLLFSVGSHGAGPAEA